MSVRGSAPSAGPPLPRPEYTDEPRKRRWPSLELLLIGTVAAALLRPTIAGFFDGAAIQTFATIFVSITLQAVPFIVLGVVIGGVIEAFVPSGFFRRALPRRPLLAVPVAGAAGVFLPGCECGSIPVAARLISRGANPAPALAFLLAAPAVNPIVIVSTAVAFPGQPMVVVARFVASLATAVIVGLLWLRFGSESLTERARRRTTDEGHRWQRFRDAVAHDFLQAGGFLVLGAAAAATLQIVVPRSVLDSVAGSGVVAIAVLALLAVVLSICSEADAFVAAGLSQFSITSRLVFLVVGPAVDLKLIALQIGTFGRPFASRFAPMTFAVAVVSALIVGAVLLES